MKRAVFKQNKQTMRQYQEEKIMDPERSYVLFKNKKSGLLDYRIFNVPGATLSPKEYGYIFEDSYIVETTSDGRVCSLIIDDFLKYNNGTTYTHITFDEE